MYMRRQLWNGARLGPQTTPRFDWAASQLKLQEVMVSSSRQEPKLSPNMQQQNHLSVTDGAHRTFYMLNSSRINSRSALFPPSASISVISVRVSADRSPPAQTEKQLNQGQGRPEARLFLHGGAACNKRFHLRFRVRRLKTVIHAAVTQYIQRDWTRGNETFWENTCSSKPLKGQSGLPKTSNKLKFPSFSAMCTFYDDLSLTLTFKSNISVKFTFKVQKT